jgi:regulator of replication initiation timing
MSQVIDRHTFNAMLKAADSNLKKMSVPRALSNRRSVDEWFDTIAADAGHSVEGIISEGRHLREAKDELDHHGEWLPLLERLKIGERYAQMLMKIAANEVLANPNHWFVLPRSWRTLYELSTLPREVLKARIADGTITPAFTRKNVAALKGKPARSQNLHRRDLAESQKAMAAAKAATLRKGQHADAPAGPSSQEPAGASSQEEAATRYSIGKLCELEERIAELDAELEDARETARERERENDRLQSEVETLRAKVAELKDREAPQAQSARESAGRVIELTEDDMRRRKEEMDLLESLGQLTFGWRKRRGMPCPLCTSVEVAREFLVAADTTEVDAS